MNSDSWILAFARITENIDVETGFLIESGMTEKTRVEGNGKHNFFHFFIEENRSIIEANTG
jgi:hypothetical protein